MQNNTEINALLNLIDDPNEEIYIVVADRIIEYGTLIIPNLEYVWALTQDDHVQLRIETLIHSIHYKNLEIEFLKWSTIDQPDLLTGAILIAKFQYPELDITTIRTQYDQIKRNVWLELNNYLTPIEQINVLHTILYNYYKMHGHDLKEHNPKHFFINQVLESKQGNAYTLGILILTLCDSLDLPIYAVDIPRQFLFGYIDSIHNYHLSEYNGVSPIQFFLDPVNCMVYTHTDVNTYLKKLNAKDIEKYYKPISTKKIIYKMMEELSLCYRYKQQDTKADEICELMQLICRQKVEK